MIFWTTFSIFALFLVAESITSWFFIRVSKNKHPELWRHAGEPTLIGNGDLVNAWSLNKYLMARRFQELENADAQLFAEKMRLPFVLSYFLALFFAAVFGVCFLIFGVP